MKWQYDFKQDHLPYWKYEQFNRSGICRIYSAWFLHLTYQNNFDVHAAMKQLLHLCPPPDKTATGKPDGLNYLKNWREFHRRGASASRFARTWAMVSKNTPAIIHGIDSKKGTNSGNISEERIFFAFLYRWIAYHSQSLPSYPPPPILMCLRLSENERNAHAVAVIQDREGFIYVFDPNYGLSKRIRCAIEFQCYIKASYENSTTAVVSACSILNLINMNSSDDIDRILQYILENQLSKAAIQRIGLSDYLYDEALEKQEELLRDHKELLVRQNYLLSWLQTQQTLATAGGLQPVPPPFVPTDPLSPGNAGDQRPQQTPGPHSDPYNPLQHNLLQYNRSQNNDDCQASCPFDLLRCF